MKTLFRILFLGTPNFAVPILEALHHHHEVVGVITQPDKPVGRKQELKSSPVKIKAQQLDIPVFQPEKASEIPSLVNTSMIDFLITAAYGQYLPPDVLKLPKKDALNVHVSLLPKYRGATPMQTALLNGDTVTGVSIVRMVKKIDTGPVFAKRKIHIDPEIHYPDFEKTAAKTGAGLLLEVLDQYDRISPVEQDDSDATICSKIQKNDGMADFKNKTAIQLFNMLRAFTPWPGVWSTFGGKILSLIDFEVFQKHSSLAPGSVFEDQGDVFISCAKGILHVKTLQLEGKKIAPGKDFVNGHRQFIGSQLPS